MSPAVVAEGAVSRSPKAVWFLLWKRNHTVRHLSDKLAATECCRRNTWENDITLFQTWERLPSHPILFWNSISEPTKQHPKALVYSRKVCARLVSKVNIKKCIMWSKYLRSWGADGEIISHLLASFRSARFKFDESQRLNLTYNVCYPQLNMLASHDMDIHLVGRIATVFVLHNCIATRKWGHFIGPDALEGSKHWSIMILVELSLR